MFLEGILSIAGQPGLLKLVSRKNTSVIVESLITGKRMPAFSTSRISTLEDITVYTYDDDTPLKDVFVNIFNQYKGAITDVTAKSANTELAAFFEKVLPNYEKEKVYMSDQEDCFMVQPLGRKGHHHRGIDKGILGRKSKS